MQSSESVRQWQVTCVCGWRTLGMREAVVLSVIAHGRDTLSQEVTEEDAVGQLVRVSEEPSGGASD